MDLFTPIVEPTRFHPNFINSLHPAYGGARALLQEWARGFVDRDGKFVLEFQTTYNSAFWELYVYAALKQFGRTVDFSFDAPDFVVTSAPNFCIEAVTAQAAAGALNEWETPLEDFWGSIHTLSRAPLVDQATVRLANSLTGKHRKYREQYANLPHVNGKPFVLALAPFEQPFFYLQLHQAILRTLFGYDLSTTDQQTGSANHRFMREIRKPNGSSIPLGYFTNDGMREISAVLFSSTATFGKLQALNKDEQERTVIQALRFDAKSRGIRQEVNEGHDYRETVLDGLSVYYNPFASHPLDPTIFGAPEVAHYTFDPKTGTLHCNIPDGALMQRIIVTVHPMGAENKR